ncbi:MAG: hypothetical protein JXR14_07835 [Paracoccaceae bacterium]
MSSTINYGNMMHRAMRALIADVLSDVAENGLPGDHHFFITFDTQHPDVEMADWLFDRYPEEMTIVVQNWFEDLYVSPDSFQITLNFGDSPEPLVIPFDAIRTFVDPSVEFGLRFESHDEEVDDTDIADHPELDLTEIALNGNKTAASNAEEPEQEKTSEKTGDAQVVSLDSFRK